ncbi:hypothetical protein ABZ568_19685 [Streptomyces olindensis]|uniref:Uncharacterized protein n=1 Tax=Streptomyces olindensis TaxID=358823 RepID=A0ABV2XX29_9ACTN
MREFARELRELVGSSYGTSGAHLGKAEMSRICNGHRLVGLDTLHRILRFKGADPKKVEYWELRWVLAYRHLEASGGKALAKRPGEAQAVREIAARNADRLRILAEEVQAKQDLARSRALRDTEKLFKEIDKSLPNSRRKFGYGPAACWVDLTDYLDRLIPLFTARKSDEERGTQCLTEILPGLAELTEITGVAEWRELADQIATAYEEAHHDGWEVAPSSGLELTTPLVYVDRYSHFRMQAGQRAAQLARQSAFLRKEPKLALPAPLDLDRYDPPRSHYRHAAPVSAACAGALPLALWTTGAPAPWLAVGAYSLVVFLSMWLVCLAHGADARPD